MEIPTTPRAGQRLLCVGFFPYDVDHLVTVARQARQRLGLEPVFVSVAPPSTAEEVRRQVEGEGFRTIDAPLGVTDGARLTSPRHGNPLRAFQRLREANAELVDRLLAAVEPAAVLASVNPPPGLVLDRAARRGIPTVLLQLFFWGSRSYHRAWRADDLRHQERRFSRKAKARRRAERWLADRFGVGHHIPWDLRHAHIAVQGPALRGRLVAEGVPAEHVVVTGNPLLDGLHRLAQEPEAARARVASELGRPLDGPLVSYFRNHEDRLLSLGRADRERSQAQTITALRSASSDAVVVVKIHPREGDDERRLVASIDPEVVVVGDEVAADDLIVASDVTVATMSTTLLHAVALDRPAVSAFLWPGLDYWRDATDWSGVERVEHPDDLARAVRAHLDDPEHRAAWSRRRQAFRDDEFVFDGHGTDRVVDLLDGLLQASPLTSGATAR